MFFFPLSLSLYNNNKGKCDVSRPPQEEQVYTLFCFLLAIIMSATLSLDPQKKHGDENVHQ